LLQSGKLQHIIPANKNKIPHLSYPPNIGTSPASIVVHQKGVYIFSLATYCKLVLNSIVYIRPGAVTPNMLNPFFKIIFVAAA